MKRKWLATGIILLFIGTCIIPTIAQKTEKSHGTSRGNWLYVGGSGSGNYTKIQDAIIVSSEGDTVFVYDDSSPYYEHLVANKSINLIGEETNTTIIDGSNDNDVVIFSADCIYLEGFTIRNSGEHYSQTQDSGVEVVDCDGCYIINCLFTDNTVGVHLKNSSYNVISNCAFISNTIGIDFYDYFNLASSHSYNWIFYNTLQYNGNAISLGHTISLHNTIMGNNISYNSQGIYLVKSQYNEILYNNIFDNDNYGVEIKNYEGEWEYNTLHHNNFVLNNGGDIQGCDNYDGLNFWYNPNQNQGNYWSDYNGLDNNGDGIGDTPYDIDGMSNLQDLYPLIKSTTPPALENHAPSSPKIIGVMNGKVGKQYLCTFSSWDPDGDEVFLNVYWGDGTSTGYIGPYASNERVDLHHKWLHSGYFIITAQANDIWNSYSQQSSRPVEMLTQAPTPPFIEGTTNGKPKVNYTYNFTSTNTENDSISYYIDWGDGTNTGWLGDYESGQMIQSTHQWDAKGSYLIQAKAKDPYGESNWTTLSVTMPLAYIPPWMSFWMKLFERFPSGFPVLRRLMEYF